MKTGLWGVIAAVWMLVGAGGAFGQSGDERIVAAREAVRTGDRATLERLAVQREPHVLDPYVRYWLLTNLLARSDEPMPTEQIAEFLVQESGSLLAERLRIDWLRRMAKDGDWLGFLRVFPDLREPDQELSCYAWQGRLVTGDATVLAEVATRWRTLVNAPAVCDPVLQAAAANGRVSRDELWWRFRHQVGGSVPAIARTTLSWLPSAEAPPARDFDKAIGNPAAYLKHLPRAFAANRSGRELALAALTRLARDDAQAAEASLTRLKSRLHPDERAYVYGQLGLYGAIEQLPEAMAWFHAAGSAPLNARQRAWRVRAALRAQDWKTVREAILAMPDDEQTLPEWTYWCGRAESARGHADTAQALYERIADQTSFYGLLAAEELGRPFVAPATERGVSDEDRRRAAEDAGLRRALALYRLDMRTEAMREWNWALRGQDDGFLLAAAHLALDNDLYDRAINTAERADPRANFELRFLTPYRKLIEPQVRRQGLDIGWVYGLMRQESRFIAPARSGAGAQGLMQVMPATGRWVAKKIGLQPYSPNMLVDPDTNVLLGTSYMRLILEGLDNHPVLASAGYNAGPNRARRWRDNAPLEGAIYAETIPIDETRDYVKKVMTNTVIYAAMLEGRPQSLKERLGTIAPRDD